MKEKLADKKLQEAILMEKERGTPDIEIGKKYGVTYRYIEHVITKSKGINVSVLNGIRKIKKFSPKDFKEEQSSVWSFRQRGDWATHNGSYRGNWSPYIPRNVILKYSKPGEVVLDYFCGAGTTAVEAKLLGRRCIALDINDKAIELAKKSIDFRIGSCQLGLLENKFPLPIYEPQLLVGDARDLSFIQTNSIDLICAHPPYANIIHYTDSKPGDLSFLAIEEFLREMAKVALESYRVLKPGRQCAILIGDMRKQKHIIPLGFKLIDVYLKAGFKLRELIIKRQHNCKTTGFWYANSIKYNFLLLAHEYLPIFEKPLEPSIVKEEAEIYSDIASKTIKPNFKRRLKELETTTVWIFPEKDFEELMNKNIIKRYWRGDGYKIITLLPIPQEDLSDNRMKCRRNSLIFIKTLFLDHGLPPSAINLYLEEIKTIINRELPYLNRQDYLVIETNDVRINGYIESLAKWIIDTISNKKLWLKEIIVVAKNEEDIIVENSKNNYLNIIHKYLLVYEVI